MPLLPERADKREMSIHRRGAAGGRAFTLVEVLVTLGVIATLMAILLPAIGHAKRSARTFRCQVSLRSAAFDFQVFADEQLHGDRGGDEQLLGDKFRLETFQNSQYGLQEFWRWEAAKEHTLPDPAGFDPLRCAEVTGTVRLLKDTPCSGGGVTPPQNVSYTFNGRLNRAEVTKANGKVGAAPVLLTSDILNHPMAPLAWDVDGALAFEREVSPVFSAPAMNDKAVYAGNVYWFPAFRHGGQANFALIDGSVKATARPLEESAWEWAYQPIR